MSVSRAGSGRAAAAVLLVLAGAAAGCTTAVAGSAAPDPKALSAPATPAPDPTTPGPSTPAAPTSPAAPAGYLLRGPGFVVTFDGKPTESTSPVPEVPNTKVHLYSYSDALGYGQTLGYIDYPAGIGTADPTTVLNGARDGAIKNVPGGVLTSSTPVTVDGKPGLDAAGTVRGGFIRSRIVVDGSRLYQVISVGTTDPKDRHRAFAESFRLS